MLPYLTKQTSLATWLTVKWTVATLNLQLFLQLEVSAMLSRTFLVAAHSAGKRFGIFTITGQKRLVCHTERLLHPDS